MAKTFRERLEGLRSKTNDSVGHVQQKGSLTGTGSGSRHLDVYGASKSAGASKGASWANDSHISVDGTFRHTNGLYPDVHGHVIPFERSVNFSGGVTQPPVALTHADVARARIHDSVIRYKMSGQRSGRTFQEERAKVRKNVQNKVGK